MKAAAVPDRGLAGRLLAPLLHVVYRPLLRDDDPPFVRTRKLGVAALFCTSLCGVFYVVYHVVSIAARPAVAAETARMVGFAAWV
eukprot:CAMPEP_0174874146 /NCGR_PEP_ID=MMETSP1114-20130205/76205_1 /TAXON_ID=312471 /ORGANISM="Neobodo designis, Strain CCAP 1951/1" /LENGTH=84 /DNA_ID=CAMNT_0016109473 /DNA_START=34 /DNA_END=285 /DNA_ORIENTATION=+